MPEQVPISWLKPKNDFIFKLIFGSDNQHSKELLIAFLNDVLNVPEGQSLTTVEILNPILNQQDIVDKYSILDVKARAAGYGYVNVEIQLTNQKNIHKRSLYYGAKVYEEQLSRGEDYRKLSRVVAINILDFSYFTSDSYRSCYRLMEEYSQESFPDLLQLHFIEMPKFIRQEQLMRVNRNDRMEKWLSFLTNEEDSRWEVMAKQDPSIEKAVDILKAASLDTQTRMQYEAREKALKDIASIRGDGMREGIQIGKQEGIQIGKQEGKKEGKKDIAKKMLRKGMDIELIVEMAELPKEEVLRLKEELN